MAEIGLAVDQAFALGRSIPPDVIDEKQIEVAVVVHIEPDGAGRPPAAVVDSRARGDVGERAVALVPIQHHAMKTANQQVETAVVVVIAGGRGEVVVSATELGARGYIVESETAQIAQ